jgi:molybdate transport system permease protein
MPDLSPLWLSLQTAGLATALVLPPGVAAAWWLAHGPRIPGKGLLELLLALPLVLPPTAVGYGLLLLLGHGTPVGRWLNDVAGVRLLFTWQGAAVAASVMALPLFTLTASAAFAAIDPEMLEAGRVLGAGNAALARHVVVPLAYRGLLAGVTLAFARALGEFGATLMVAGSIPGRTRTLPLALYAAVQTGKTQDAVSYTAILSLTAFVLLAGVAAYRNRLTTARAGPR